MSMTTTHWRRRAVVLAAGAALTLGPATAHAADPNPVFTLKHDVVGTTHINKTGSSIAIKPTTLTSHIDSSNGGFTGSLPLPSTSTEFKALGFASVKADVSFVPVGDVVGHIDLTQTQAKVTSTANYYVKLSNIKIFGFPTFAGPFCTTKTPASIPANTPTGEGFDIIEGGNLEGTFTLPEFQFCGINTPLINSLVPGAGNTVELQVSNGVVVE